jgi:hypothetical protein
MRIIILGLFFLNSLIIVQSKCPNDSSKWCSTVEIANDCHVINL